MRWFEKGVFFETRVVHPPLVGAEVHSGRVGVERSRRQRLGVHLPLQAVSTCRDEEALRRITGAGGCSISQSLFFAWMTSEST